MAILKDLIVQGPSRLIGRALGRITNAECAQCDENGNRLSRAYERDGTIVFTSTSDPRYNASTQELTVPWYATKLIFKGNFSSWNVAYITGGEPNSETGGFINGQSLTIAADIGSGNYAPTFVKGSYSYGCFYHLYYSKSMRGYARSGNQLNNGASLKFIFWYDEGYLDYNGINIGRCWGSWYSVNLV